MREITLWLLAIKFSVINHKTVYHTNNPNNSRYYFATRTRIHKLRSVFKSWLKFMRLTDFRTIIDYTRVYMFRSNMSQYLILLAEHQMEGLTSVDGHFRCWVEFSRKPEASGRPARSEFNISHRLSFLSSNYQLVNEIRGAHIGIYRFRIRENELIPWEWILCFDRIEEDCKSTG